MSATQSTREALPLLALVALRGREDLLEQVLAPAIHGLWPDFMHDPVAKIYFERLQFEELGFEDCRDTAFAVVEPGRPEIAVGRALAVPFAWRGVPGREALPDTGWDGVLRWAAEDRALGRTPDALSALEITLLPSHRGAGGSAVVLDAMRRCAAERGLQHMVAPVRPTGKAAEPLTPMRDYAYRAREDGLPADPWLRVHVRAGGRIEKVAPLSQTIPGTLAQWRDWTGLPFDVTGPVLAPGALAPVHCSVEHDHAVLVEANIWVRHTVPTG